MPLRSLVVAAAAVVVLLATAGCTAEEPEPPPVPRYASLLPDPDPDDFDPGLIVSDDSFYNADAMTATQVQHFFESRRCTPSDGVPCLADYREDTPDKAAEEDGHCDAYEGTRRELASTIIAKVAQACGVSPRALLVLLQKEQSLVTHPSAYGYDRATGYACPDGADCDTRYFGFFNQVYAAAWQFRQYTQYTERRYEVGANDVQFHPDPGCGAASVVIRNQATAGLYNYTPYQPNEATLDDPGSGDGCSAWGNFNFWRIWHRWFGDPLAERFDAFFPPCANLADGQACPVEPAWPLGTAGRG
ncbi:hypothetical protein [Agromyces mangrovi Wang et al. 2018]|uniref:hypothetical protein n=1 Tax=Agromyces mangrovi TaxID=1858653 RepID=UPI00257370DD|nr:hypothetical protein [Agromyces mangrovi]BDZ65927.1 hypothetical protein GCM10025877_28650 [Agromyces mangrovi]